MQLEFSHSKHEIGNVYSFFFNSDSLKSWVPGEYFNLTMPDVPPVYADRLFSIASAPHEDYIQITTWIGLSPFKQQLLKLKPGDKVEADQLGGDFTLNNIPPSVIHTKAGISKRLFLAGGIGITPYRSMLVNAINKKQALNTILLWSGKSDGRPFVDEIDEISKKDPTFTIHHFVDQRLDLGKIKHSVPDLQERVIYLAGSQPFVDGLGEALMSSGIPRTQLKYDWFDGYLEDI